MAAGTVQLAPDSTGKIIDTSELTVGANTVERQRIVLADDTAAAGLAKVTNAAPGTSDYGLVVRTAGQTIIQGLQPAATTGTITTASSNVPSAAGLDVQQYNIATVRISGTYAGVNITFEQSDDGGTTWYTTQGARCDSGVIESSSGALTNTTRAWDIPIGGANRLRVRSTAWTSGTANIAIGIQSFAYDPCPGAVCQGTAASGSAALGNPVLIGGTDGTNARTLSVTTGGVLNVTGTLNTTPTTPTTNFTNSAASTNSTSVKSSAGSLYSVVATNNGAAAAFLKLYNKASAPTVGTDIPVLVLAIPATGKVDIDCGRQGLRFSTGIAFAITNLIGDSDTTAVAASQVKVATTYI